MPDTEVSAPTNMDCMESKGNGRLKGARSADIHSKGSDVTSDTVKDKKEEKKENGLIENIDISREARNRVKLYVLCDQRVWDDRGTGHVACVQIPDQQGFVIIVRLESATNGADKNLLESKILMDTVYQKQQV
ncbi:hypothetical protein DICVIV_03511 [Dictyocaulus viviparus]|uniref:Uncharacterized protein n=1 Tax=Dictyocaulus viviparus TaxID=29172 RepID=A0A0D8Y0D5_DICVI|nr:hypothetical protein DICVIV_03511 [Dictyocaulus viviparus]